MLTIYIHRKTEQETRALTTLKNRLHVLNANATVSNSTPQGVLQRIERTLSLVTVAPQGEGSRSGPSGRAANAAPSAFHVALRMRGDA